MLATKLAVPVVLLGVIAAGVSAAPMGADSGSMPGKFRDAPLGRLISGTLGRLLVLRSEVNVTPQQREKVQEVVKSHKSEIGEVVKDLVAKKRALREAIRSDKPDDAAIRKAADELGHSIGNAAVLAAKVRGELKPAFTDQQVELFQKFVSDQDAAVDRWVQEVFGK